MRYDLEPTQPMEPAEPMEPMRPAQPDRPIAPMRSQQAAQPRRRLTNPNEATVPPWYNASRIVYLILGIVEALLLIRLILRLLAANPTAGFSSLIYGITGPLVAPFQGVFPNAQGSGSVLEVATILAMIVYALVAWGIVRLIAIAARREITPTA